MDRAELADFLRRRREALQPPDVGLPATARRRTPGLRREEVAALAHMSTDFLERLEQRRGSRPSPQMVAALARALRLTPDERAHLFLLAGHTPPPRAHRTDHPSPGLLRVLARVDAPAQIVTDLGVTLAQNPLARALVGDQTRETGPRRSIVYRWFTDPAQRALHPESEHDWHARAHVAGLRAVHARDPDDGEARELVDVLLRDSEAFAALWARHEVGVRSDGVKVFLHPMVGAIELDCQVLTAENIVERLVLFTPAPDSPAADAIALLRVVGSADLAATPG